MRHRFPLTAAPLALALLLLASAPASAHITMTSPAPRYADQKEGPCGRAGGMRTGNVTTFTPGETITVTWTETINHPGHYRISFDADGDDDFADPASYTDFDSNAAVLLDNITDMSGGAYSAQVTLPNVECQNCTLQLIQMMTDKPPYTTPGNDIYYQCADLVLAGGGGGTADAGVGGGGDDEGDGGCAVGGRRGEASGLGALLAVTLALALASRRRR